MSNLATRFVQMMLGGQNYCNCNMLGITNGESMKRAEMEELLNIARVRRLTVTGHILRLAPDRPASVAMQWEPDGGRRRRGRPRKTW